MNVRTQFETDLVEILPELRRTALKRLRNVPDADDLVSRSVLKALNAWEQFQPGTNFKAWMHRILFNEMISGFRRQKRAPISLEDGDVGMASCPARQELILEARCVRDTINRLPPVWRHALTRVCVEGWTYEEAAAEIGASVGTIKSRLWRAREAIDQMMGVA